MSTISRVGLRVLLGTTFGTGIVLGATGLFVIFQLIKRWEEKKTNKRKDYDDLVVTYKNGSVNIHSEIKGKRTTSLSESRLSLLSNSSHSSRFKRNALDSEDDMFSALDSEADEFFDFSSDEEESSFRSLRERSSSINDATALHLFEEVDTLLKGDDDDRLNALKLLQQDEDLYAENPFFLWRMAKAYQMQASAAEAQKRKEKRKEYVQKGLSYAGKALEIDPSNSDAHKWYAILVGMNGEYLSLKDKINSGLMFQHHITEAIRTKPKDPTLFHLLGRFKYQIGNLSWAEKKLASALFADLPQVTLNDALKDFERAEEFNPIPWKENRLFIAKCHIGIGNYAEAYDWLVCTREITPVTQDDHACDRESDLLMSKYEKYKRK